MIDIFTNNLLSVLHFFTNGFLFPLHTMKLKPPNPHAFHIHLLPHTYPATTTLVKVSQLTNVGVPASVHPAF